MRSALIYDGIFGKVEEVVKDLGRDTEYDSSGAAFRALHFAVNVAGH